MALTREIPYGFDVPESVLVGGLSLRALLDAIVREDREAVADMRCACASDPTSFDRFVGAVNDLAAGDPVCAADAFATVESTSWRLAAAMLRALALAASDRLADGFALRNHWSDLVRGDPDGPSFRSDAALLRATARCLQRAEAAAPPVVGRGVAGTPFRYVVGYPRSGSTMLLQFLAYAFDEPTYTVYPALARYFSRDFHAGDPTRAVFVKDHVLQAHYLRHPILAPMRDGRDAIVSLARYLFAEGSSPFVHRGELADFMTFVAERMPYGFWAQHTRALLDAQEQGTPVRLVRYEEFVGNHAQFLTLARELAGAAVAREDEAGFLAFVAEHKRRLATRPQWSEGIPLPEDTFVARNWSIGGGTTDWRRTFDAAARRRFHELGGTEALLRLGYETDEGWWRGE